MTGCCPTRGKLTALKPFARRMAAAGTPYLCDNVSIVSPALTVTLVPPSRVHEVGAGEGRHAADERDPVTSGAALDGYGERPLPPPMVPSCTVFALTRGGGGGSGAARGRASTRAVGAACAVEPVTSPGPAASRAL